MGPEPRSPTNCSRSRWEVVRTANEIERDFVVDGLEVGYKTVSHNANLVVNGDAELVAWCDYRTPGDHCGGRIRPVGAIDIPEICAAIKQAMEGGEAAFKLRKEKYGF